MARYRKKPVVVEAVQFLPGDGYKQGDRFEAHGLAHVIHEGRTGPCLLIDTAEGEMRADYGDWIIRGVKGELYPCKPDIFDITYEQEITTMASGLSNETASAGDDAPKTDGPTIEEFVQAGYQPADYPPAGYAEKPSPGLDAFRHYQQDPGDAKAHAEAAHCLGVSVGELTHGKVGELVDLVAGGVRRTDGADAVGAGAGAGITGSEPTLAELNAGLAREPGIDAGATGSTDVSALAEQVGEQQRREDADAGGAENARRGLRAAALRAQGQSDPGTLTEAEVGELVELERLGF